MKAISDLVLAAVASSAVASGGDHSVRYDRSVGTPFSPAVQVGDILYLSGQIGAAPGTARLAEGVSGQAKQAMQNIGSVLSRHGLSFDDVFKCTVMLADMSTWGEFNTVYVSFFKTDRLPARSAFGANGLAMGAALEIECWAKVPSRR